MGQKVNPRAFRTGILFPWSSKWYSAPKSFASTLQSDVTIRKFLLSKLKNAGVAKLEIERTMNAITIVIYALKPGVVIGRQGAGVEEMKQKIKTKFFGDAKVAIHVNIFELDRPQLNAPIVAAQMIEEIEKRMPYRRVLKTAIDRVQKAGALGVKVGVGGRLNGAEIAKRETLTWGKVPLHTLRANIDYACGTAHTMAGTIGVKVWIYKEDVFQEKNRKSTT
ncbi:30S ribosomal protein S3 [Candidatus Uhrbacteria bacterium]|nr:30S ribosomal protein S3 [Candidatus Uhrbacteria bacterium]